MSATNPVDALFGGMDKLGPGSNRDTQHVLGLLPIKRFSVTVDAGCGAGRQTIVLAKDLGTPIQAVDSYEPFLNHLKQRAKEMGVEHLVRTHCMDMKDISNVFPHIDLLWAEGAAYNIGFSNALSIWATAIKLDGFAVVSELCWLRDQVPNAVEEFFRSGYPEIKSIPENIAVAERAGYNVLHTHTLPQEAWVKDYYDVLEPRAKSLLNHSDSSVRDFAVETLREIEIFRCSEESYGYVFYVLRRANRLSH